MADRSKLYVMVAKGLAKFALTGWTGYLGLATDSIDVLAEHIKGSLGDEVTFQEARKIALQHETIVDAFASNLERFHREEGVNNRLAAAFLASRRKSRQELNQFEQRELDLFIEGEFNAALSAVVDSLANTSFTPQELMDIRLEPFKIELTIRHANRDATRDLSDTGRQLYQQSLKDCCQLLIGFSARMPEFNVAAVRSILTGQDNIAEKIEILSREISSIMSSERGADDQNMADFTSRVKFFLSQQLSRIEQFGVSKDGEASQDYDLSTAFVELDALVLDSTGAATRAEITSALATAKRFFIRGEAGTGKTTVLQWIAQMSAGCRLTEVLDEYNSKIPVFIRLRSVDIGELKSSSLLDFIAPVLTASQPPGWIGQCLNEGRFLFLLDGLDEVASEHRRDVKAWLETMIMEYPDQYFFITSRPSAVPSHWLDSLGFTVMNVPPMSGRKIEIFIERWHDAVAKSSDLKLNAEELDKCRSRVLSAVRTNNEIRAVSAYPLLASILCTMSLQLAGALPRNRMEFYSNAIGTLLDKRDKAAKVVTTTATNLTLAERRQFMQDLAYWLVQNRLSETDSAGAKRSFERTGKNLLKVGAEAEVIYDFLLERSGLLREPSSGTVEFIHKSFQEYLAAAAFVAHDLLQALVNSAHLDEFRETFIMAVGHSVGVHRDALIELLVRRFAAEEGKVKRDLGLVLAASLEVCDVLDPAMRDKVLSAVREIAPPTDIFEAVYFSHAVETDRDLFDGVDLNSSQSVVSTVTALTFTGRPEVLDKVGAFCDRTDAEVVAALFAGSEYFMATEYAKKIFPRIQFNGHAFIQEKTIRFWEEGGVDVTVQLNPLINLEVFRGMNGLKSLTIISHSRLQDVSAVLDCAMLQEVRLEHVPETLGFEVLIQHPVLEKLVLGERITLDENRLQNVVRPASATRLSVVSPHFRSGLKTEHSNIRFEPPPAAESQLETPS